MFSFSFISVCSHSLMVPMISSLTSFLSFFLLLLLLFFFFLVVCLCYRLLFCGYYKVFINYLIDKIEFFLLTIS